MKIHSPTLQAGIHLWAGDKLCMVATLFVYCFLILFLFWLSFFLRSCVYNFFYFTFYYSCFFLLRVAYFTQGWVPFCNYFQSSRSASLHMSLSVQQTYFFFYYYLRQCWSSCYFLISLLKFTPFFSMLNILLVIFALLCSFRFFCANFILSFSVNAFNAEPDPASLPLLFFCAIFYLFHNILSSTAYVQ